MMQPSRGFVQVTLDDSSSTRPVHCKLPVPQQKQTQTQVKILRRPKPIQDIDTHTSNNHHQQQDALNSTFKFSSINNNNSSHHIRTSGAEFAKSSTSLSPASSSSTQLTGPGHNLTGLNSTHLIRSYEARADEYAKARLRILGSEGTESGASNQLDRRKS